MQGADLVAILMLMMVITVARDGDDDEDGDNVLSISFTGSIRTKSTSKLISTEQT